MNLVLIVASLLVVLMFFLSGVNKVQTFAQQVKQFAKKFSVPLALAQLVMVGVIVLELLAPYTIVHYTIFGTAMLKPLVKLSIVGLLVFTGLCNALYHWPASGANYYAFMSNLSTMGGLLFMYMLLP